MRNATLIGFPGGWLVKPEGRAATKFQSREAALAYCRKWGFRVRTPYDGRDSVRTSWVKDSHILRSAGGALLGREYQNRTSFERNAAPIGRWSQK